MKSLFFISLLVFVGCQSETQPDFTFYKWNIRESYYLKYNATDTLYFISSYSFEEKTAYTILKPDEKEKIQNILDSISFPKDKIDFDSSVDDGVTYGFNLKDEKHSQKLKIHGNAGPKQFWEFGKSNIFSDIVV